MLVGKRKQRWFDIANAVRLKIKKGLNPCRVKRFRIWIRIQEFKFRSFNQKIEPVSSF